MLDDSTALTAAGEQLFPLLRVHGVEPFEYRGQPAFLPRQVAVALGYTAARHMIDAAARVGWEEGQHFAVLTGDDLATVKGLDIPGLVGGRTSWRETVLFLPGLLLILDETKKAGESSLGLAFRRWRRGFDVSALALARQPAAPISPKQIEMRPVDQLVAIVKAGTPLAQVFSAEYLRQQAGLAVGREKADRERFAEEQTRIRAKENAQAREELVAFKATLAENRRAVRERMQARKH